MRQSHPYTKARPSGIDPAEAPYQGAWGATRQEFMQVVAPTGALQTVTVYTVINTMTHPSLAMAACEGTLHQTSTGQQLAVPFVYHDPSRRKFVLVIPESLAERELTERGLLLQRLGQEGTSLVPEYVREGSTVIGLSALKHELGITQPIATSGLADIARHVTEIPSSEDYTSEPVAAQEVEEIASSVDSEDVEEIEGDEEVEEIENEELEEVDVTDAVEVVESVAGDLDVEAVGDDDIEEVLDEDLLDTAVYLEHAGRPEDVELGAHRDLPSGFPLGEGGDTLVVELGDELVLRVRLADDELGFEDREKLDMIIQRVPMMGFRPVLLVVIDRNHPESLIRRAALDLSVASERAVIEYLSSSFQARLQVYGQNGEFLREVSLSSPRERNAERVLQVTPAQVQIPKSIKDEALNSPPPTSNIGHPFTSRAVQLGARDVYRQLRTLDRWLASERFDRATMTLCVPIPRVEQVIEKQLQVALASGFNLPDRLLAEAVKRRMAPTKKALVTDLLETFTVKVTKQDTELEAINIALNWEHLLDAAFLHEIIPDEKITNLAWKSIVDAYASQDHRDSLAKVRKEEVRNLKDSELRVVLKHPTLRRIAIEELSIRGSEAASDVVCEALTKLSRDDIVAVLPKMVRLGSHIGEGLLRALASPRPLVRHAALLGLEEIRYDKAVIPLVHTLKAEQTLLWRETARALGTFGTEAFERVVASLGDSEEHQKRCALALAYLANHGCDAKLLELSKGTDLVAAEVARIASRYRDRAHDYEEEVFGEEDVSSKSKEAEFARRILSEFGSPRTP